jgi:hypothetical protein
LAANWCNAAAFVLLVASPAVAQQARPSIFAVDSVAGIDETVDESSTWTTGVILDSVVSADMGRGFQAIVRPFVQRLNSGEWNRQVWVAQVRYERAGTVGVRVDAGLIPAPIGLANLTLRPHLIPTISQPVSLFTALPQVEPNAPRTTLMGAIYPFGGQVSVSTLRWDARAAVIDTSPLRPRRIFARVNPPRFTNVVAGGGVTPFVGLRIGATLARGGWQHAGETPFVAADRDATVVTVETEFSFRYTKLAGEWVRNSLETVSGDATVSGWFVHGQQTLAPRWFVGGRVERMSVPPYGAGRQHLMGTEEVVGYRLTPEITVRAGHRARRPFGRPGFDHQATMSVVWWKRWI